MHSHIAALDSICNTHEVVGVFEPEFVCTPHTESPRLLAQMINILRFVVIQILLRSHIMTNTNDEIDIYG